MLTKQQGLSWVNDPVRTEDQLRRAAVQLSITHTGRLTDVKTAIVAKLTALANDTDPSGINPAALPALPTPAPAPAQPAPVTPSRLPNWVIPVILIVAVLLCVGGFWAVNKSNTSPAATPTKVSPTTKPTEAATQAPVVATKAPTNTPEATAQPTEAATQVANTEGKAIAEQLLGKTLPWPPEPYSAHKGEAGFPDVCSGLCWNLDKVDQGVMLWYGPTSAEEDIAQSDAKFGDGQPGPLDLMRTGKVTHVVFANTMDAQLEVCAIGTLDGQPLTSLLGVKDGECGKRIAINAGWHVIEGNANSPIAGFGVRFTANGWSGMTESQIVTYTSYWSVSTDTATWKGPDGVEILMPPSLVAMMQDYGTIKKVVFTTSQTGKVLFCNGSVTGAATLNSKDGACHLYDVPAGTFTYNGEARLSAGISWQPSAK